MDKFINALVSLLKIKSLVTIAVTTVFVILALRGDIPSEVAMTVVTMVVSFYFGTQHEKKSEG